jgi:leucyl-tRNA synthetase
LESIDVQFTDAAPEKIKEDCCPGQPFITFATDPYVTIEAVNPVPHNGLFTEFLKIMEGDDAGKLAGRLAKSCRAIKGNFFISKLCVHLFELLFNFRLCVTSVVEV